MNIKVVRAFYHMTEKSNVRVSMFSDPFYVLLHFKDPMLLKLNGKEIITSENAFIIYEPSCYQDYSLYCGTFENDYVWFTLDDPDEFAAEFSISFNKPFYLKDVIDLDDIGLITWFLTDRVDSHEEDISSCFIALLERISKNVVEHSVSDEQHLQAKKRLIEIRYGLMDNPENQSVESVAKRAYMSVSVFTQQYKRLFGISPGNDIHILTIEKAKKMLNNGGLSVSEISEALGCSSTGNFIRAFKKQVGVTPYRYKSNK